MSRPKTKKMKKHAALDKQHSDAERNPRGRRREQHNKAQHHPRKRILASECFGLSRVRCAGWRRIKMLAQAQERTLAEIGLYLSPEISR